MLVLFALTVTGVVLASSLVGRFAGKNQTREEIELRNLRSNFVAAVEKTQSIPSYTNWQQTLAPFAVRAQAGLAQVNPEFGSDATLNRVLLLDPNLPAGLLPYRQPALGLSGVDTNLMGSAARLMIVSSTKRGLALPFSSGVVASNTFNTLWDWNYDSSQPSPPAGWPATWDRSGEFLHVERIQLGNLFYRVVLNSLRFGVGDVSTVTNLVLSHTAYHMLYGTQLLIAATNGAIERSHVVIRDVEIDLAGTNQVGPILYYHLAESSGTVATNSGSLATNGNGSYRNGAILAAAGPRAPTYTGYTTTNTAVTLDGTNDYVQGPAGPLNNLAGFTIAAWIKPGTSTLKNVDLFGQLDIAQIGFTTPSGKLELWCSGGSKKLHYFYPYGSGAWHHIAGVGDGSKMYLYVDGLLVASRVYSTATYGNNLNSFNVGGNVFGTGQYFVGTMDEVIAYDYALTATEVARLYVNNPP